MGVVESAIKDGANTISDGAKIVVNAIAGGVDDDTTTTDNLTSFNLAASYGNLTKESFRLMDVNLIAVIGATSSMILSNKLISWEQTLKTMSDNKSVNEILERRVDKNESYIINSNDFFKVDGSPSDMDVQNIHSWFVNLIGNEDIEKSLKVDINSVARVAAQTGATVTSLASLVRKHERHEKIVTDVGMIRFPDITNPSFKVFRIELIAWADSTRTLAFEQNSRGVTCIYSFREYAPNTEFSKQVKADVLELAIKEATKIFDSANM